MEAKITKYSNFYETAEFWTLAKSKPSSKIQFTVFQIIWKTRDSDSDGLHPLQYCVKLKCHKRFWWLLKFSWLSAVPLSVVPDSNKSVNNVNYLNCKNPLQEARREWLMTNTVAWKSVEWENPIQTSFSVHFANVKRMCAFSTFS